jgi:hypothetical protein
MYDSALCEKLCCYLGRGNGRRVHTLVLLNYFRVFVKEELCFGTKAKERLGMLSLAMEKTSWDI